MGELIPFPNSAKNRLEELKRTLDEICTKADAPDDMREYLLDWLIQRFEQYEQLGTIETNLSISMPSGDLDQTALEEAVNKMVGEISEVMHNVTSHMLVDMLIAEIELYKYRGAPT